jgi:signal transduction histidine kinase
MKKFTPTLRGRLTLVYGGLFLLAGVLLVGLSYLLVSQNLENSDRSNGKTTVLRIVPRPAYLPDGTLGIETEDGRVVSQGEFRQQVQDAIRQQSEQQREAALNSLVKQSSLALGLVAIAAIGAGWLVAGRALQPLHAITATARRVADRSLHERIALDGPQDELKELADTFDDMLARLDQAFAGQSRFVANASHELRTPLAVNRTLLEVALADPATSDDLRQVGGTLLTVNQRSERMIDGLLLLAKGEHSVVDARPVDLADVVRYVAGQLSAEAAKTGVSLTRRLDPAIAVGDPVLVERLVTNLLENAIRHNAPDGWVTVSTGRAPEPGRAQLEVANGGEVIPPYEVDELFEPFRRRRDQRLGSRGAGLGLSIVRSVVTAHGGSVYAVAPAGGGLVVRVTLPTATAGEASHLRDGWPNRRAIGML